VRPLSGMRQDFPGLDEGESGSFLIDTQVCEDAHEYVLKTYENEDDALIKVCHLNIRSLRKNYDELLVFLSSLKVRNLNIIILSESWSVDLFNFNIKGFKMYYNGAVLNKNDGLVIYVKEDIHQEVQHITKDQFTFTELKLCINNFTIGILSIYRSPSTNARNFIKIMADEIRHLNQCDIGLLAGDININILDEEDILTQEYIQLLNSLGFVQCINKPTRETTDTKTCIDHFFTKIKFQHKSIFLKSFIIKTFITDHYPIILNINSKRIDKKQENIQLTQT